MKTLLLSVIIIIKGYTGSAQKSTDDLQVAYQVYSDDYRKTKYPAVLNVRDKVTVYEMKTSLSESWDGQYETNSEAFVVSNSSKQDFYLKIDHNTKELLDFAPMPGSLSSLVKDNYPEINWTVSKEIKSILGYTCIKATGTYRGREWAAWFTPEIALPYGPWKLHGLPGLILEVQSADAKYTMKAHKIKKAKSDIFDKDFKTLKPTYNKQPVTYQQHKKNEKEAFENMIAKARSEGENTTFVPAPPNGYELKYEWEE